MSLFPYSGKFEWVLEMGGVERAVVGHSHNLVGIFFFFLSSLSFHLPEKFFDCILQMVVWVGYTVLSHTNTAKRRNLEKREKPSKNLHTFPTLAEMEKRKKLCIIFFKNA